MENFIFELVVGYFKKKYIYTRVKNIILGEFSFRFSEKEEKKKKKGKSIRHECKRHFYLSAVFILYPRCSLLLVGLHQYFNRIMNTGNVRALCVA